MHVLQTRRRKKDKPENEKNKFNVALWKRGKIPNVKKK